MSEMPHRQEDEDDTEDEAQEFEEENPSYPDVWANRAKTDIDEFPPSIDVLNEWEGMTVYLPKSIRNELELSYRELSLDCKRNDGIDIEKLRDFYPLVVMLGLDQIERSDTDELLSILLRPMDSPRTPRSSQDE